MVKNHMILSIVGIKQDAMDGTETGIFVLGLIRSLSSEEGGKFHTLIPDHILIQEAEVFH